jgi:hypothetical protein
MQFLIQSKQDRLVGSSCLEEILRANPNVKATDLDGPHFILQRAPMESAGAFAEFFRAIMRHSR